MTEKPKHVLIVHETLLQSVAKDLFSAFVLLSTIWVGIYADSAALQWCTGVIWILWVFGQAASYRKNSAFSFDDARKKIDEWEGLE